MNIDNYIKFILTLLVVILLLNFFRPEIFPTSHEKSEKYLMQIERHINGIFNGSCNNEKICGDHFAEVD